MPTQRAHGGAQLVPINLTSPAFGGLNTEQEGSILDVAWATTLDNAVFDDAGRPSLRKGWNSITTTPTTGIVMRIHEYWTANETSEIIFSTDAGIYKDTTTPTAIHGTLTITEGNIKFANFNDKCIAFGVGTGGIPAVYTTTTFADITVNSGSAPTSGIGTSAFGRLWAVDTDGKTLRYSALLDETRWDVADGAGSIDFNKVWPAGQDSIVAVEEFGGDLVVFGRNNTVVMSDGAGSSLGIDPTAMYVSDTIPGVGARSQFAMTRASGDFWVLTSSGIVGLQRELVQRSTPFTSISRNVQSLIDALANSETDINDITMEYDLGNDFVVCVFPTSNKQVVFDTRAQDQGNRATTWTSDAQTVAYIRDTQDLYGSLTGVVGEVFNYTGFNDNAASYIFDYDSGWLDLGQEATQYLKFVKYLTSLVIIQQDVSVVHKIGYDFGQREYTITKAASGSAPSEYNIAEYGANGSPLAEYSGSISLRTLKAPGKGSGQYIKVGIRLDTNAGDFALQQLNLFAKIGRMAV